MCNAAKSEHKYNKKNNKIWYKVSNIYKKRFDNEPVYSAKYLRTKLKSVERKMSTDFHGDEIL